MVIGWQKKPDEINEHLKPLEVPPVTPRYNCYLPTSQEIIFR